MSTGFMHGYGSIIRSDEKRVLWMLVSGATIQALTARQERGRGRLRVRTFVDNDLVWLKPQEKMAAMKWVASWMTPVGGDGWGGGW